MELSQFRLIAFVDQVRRRFVRRANLNESLLFHVFTEMSTYATLSVFYCLHVSCPFKKEK